MENRFLVGRVITLHVFQAGSNVMDIAPRTAAPTLASTNQIRSPANAQSAAAKDVSTPVSSQIKTRSECAFRDNITETVAKAAEMGCYV